jgi:hypothetical protein
MINAAEIELLRSALATLAKGYEHLPEFTPELDEAELEKILQDAATRMQDNFPY